MAEVNDGSIIGMDGLTTRPTPVRKFVEGGFMEATLAARWGIRQTLGTYVGATSANRGMLEDADLDGLLRLGGPSGSPNSSKRWEIHPVHPSRGALDISRSVPSRLPLVERPGGVR
jgi:hypothetical protein